MNLQEIIQALQIPVQQIRRVSGGDINVAYCLHSGSKKLFLKLNDANRFPQMLEKEAKGLNVLKNATALRIPRVIKQGIVSGWQFLLLEWLETGNAQQSFWQYFGSSLAEMHKLPQDFFGFEENNYIGSLPQYNATYDNWQEFYANCRIVPLVKRLRDEGRIDVNDVTATENFSKKINEIFPQEPPALLHGDLWSGNFLISENGCAALFDPAVYYGHREMDLGMTLLFGGFAPAFYNCYDETYPLEKHWRQRIRYTQLYPLLVHAVLFGAGYLHRAREVWSCF